MTVSGVLGYSIRSVMKVSIKNKDSSIRKRVYYHLREQILCGEIGPLERLVETRIAKEIGTSRTPVREALHNLEMEKLIRSIPRVGYVVAGMNEEEVDQICQIRGVIEALAARWAMKRSRSRLLRELKRIIARQEQAIAKGDLTGYVVFDAQFHEVFAKLSGSERLLELAQTLRRYMLRYRIQCIHVEETVLRSLEGHRRILDALEAGDVETVVKTIQDHLEDAKGDILHLVLPDRQQISLPPAGRRF